MEAAGDEMRRTVQSQDPEHRPGFSLARGFWVSWQRHPFSFGQCSFCASPVGPAAVFHGSSSPYCHLGPACTAIHPALCPTHQPHPRPPLCWASMAACRIAPTLCQQQPWRRMTGSPGQSTGQRRAAAAAVGRWPSHGVAAPSRQQQQRHWQQQGHQHRQRVQPCQIWPFDQAWGPALELNVRRQHRAEPAALPLP